MTNYCDECETTFESDAPADYCSEKCLNATLEFRKKLERQAKYGPETKAGEGAFAHGGHWGNDDCWVKSQAGLTKREYFAALAMQAIVSNNELLQFFNERFGPKLIDAAVSKESVKSADALIEALNKNDSDK